MIIIEVPENRTRGGMLINPRDMGGEPAVQILVWSRDTSTSIFARREQLEEIVRALEAALEAMPPESDLGPRGPSFSSRGSGASPLSSVAATQPFRGAA